MCFEYELLCSYKSNALALQPGVLARRFELSHNRTGPLASEGLY